MSYRRKKRRVRYDRIIGVAVIFIILIIIFVSCCKSCGSDKKNDESSVIPTLSNEEKNKASENTSESGDSSSDSENESASGNDVIASSTISAMPNEVFTGNLILVNKEYEYSFPASEEDAGISLLYETCSDSYRYQDYEVALKSNVISALNKMMDSFYAQTGKGDVMVMYGYRSKEEQDGSDDGVMPGYSEFHTGLSFAICVYPEGGGSYYYIPEDEYEWIDKNCENYGFILRYPEGKESQTGMEASTYKFRYVGVPHALYMKENNMCLEEYIEELKNYTSDGEHLKISADGKKYEVYYVPADPSANTDIPVPENKEYEISGNNIDGFIITVTV